MPCGCGADLGILEHAAAGERLLAAARQAKAARCQTQAARPGASCSAAKKSGGD